MDESLRRAAQEGNVSDLYTIIERDGNVLRRVGRVEFGDTPLHIAAEKGCVDFAMEMMSLKPAFARKLNQQGLTPLHLAVDKGHDDLALLLVGTAKHLVRIKGKNGETPFHYVITKEANHQLLLLPRFLEACPECVLDLTTKNQSALHIAVVNNNLEVVKLLCKILSKTDYFKVVVNQKDINGDTALHIAARDNRHEMLKLLLKCKAEKHMTDGADKTALDVAEQHNNNESIRILRGYFTPRISALNHALQKQVVKYVTKASLVIFKNMDNISGDDRNAFLVILGLLLTTTFQASISPPGSVWQDGTTTDSSNSNSNSTKKQPGKAIMGQTSFLFFYIPASAVFIVTFFLTLGLLKPYPLGFRTALQALLASLAICFLQSIKFLAPTSSASLVIIVFSTLVFVLMMFMCIAYRVSKISVLILGCWLLSTGYDFVGVIVVGFFLILFLYEDFGKGIVLLVGYGLSFLDVFGFLRVIPLYIHLIPSLGPIITGFMLFFLYDEFWNGIFEVIGFCLLLGFATYKKTQQPVIIVGCWLVLSLCRYFTKRYYVRCNLFIRSLFSPCVFAVFFFLRFCC